MPVDTDWRRVLKFTVVGFVVGLLVAEFATLWEPSNSFADLLVVLACPGIWLFAHVGWSGSRLVFSYVFLPFANGLLYAALVGFVTLLTTIRHR
jgi:hypothetical protein